MSHIKKERDIKYYNLHIFIYIQYIYCFRLQAFLNRSIFEQVIHFHIKIKQIHLQEAVHCSSSFALALMYLLWKI